MTDDAIDYNPRDRMQRVYRNTARVLARLILLGQAEPGRIADDLHLSRSTVERCLAFWHTNRLAYIARYRRQQGSATPIWSAGEGNDAERPEAIPAAVKSQEWRARGGDSHRAEKLRKSAKRIAASMTIAGQLGVNTEGDMKCAN